VCDATVTILTQSLHRFRGDDARVRRLATTALATLVPLLALGSGVAVLVHPWFVRFEYRRSGFPPDELGLTQAERTRLALVGLRAVQPWQPGGLTRLERARLPDGTLAFQPREVRHMRQVRRRIWVLLGLDAVALPALLGLALNPRTRPVARRGLRAGAFATLALGAVVGVALAVDPIGFLTVFHEGVFFSSTSWRFADSDTVRRLYPDRFWQDTSVLLGAGATAQALALVAVTGGMPRPRTIRVCRTGS